MSTKAFKLESYNSNVPQTILGVRKDNVAFVGHEPIKYYERLEVGALASNTQRDLNTTFLEYDFTPIALVWSNEPNNANQGKITVSVHNENNDVIGQLDFNVTSVSLNGYFYIPEGVILLKENEHINITSEFNIDNLYINIKPVVMKSQIV